jgi:hypothetical protein
MSFVRKTLAKYGAKIPAAPRAGAKAARQGKEGASASSLEKAERVAKKSDDKKR